MPGSLTGHKGGRVSKARLPSDEEGLALGVGVAMQWAKLRSAAHKEFFTLVASECKRLKCTPSLWSNDELSYFATQKLFMSIPQKGIETYLVRKHQYAKKEERAELVKELGVMELSAARFRPRRCGRTSSSSRSTALRSGWCCQSQGLLLRLRAAGHQGLRVGAHARERDGRERCRFGLRARWGRLGMAGDDWG